jgi:hypothetical protein
LHKQVYNKSIRQNNIEAHDKLAVLKNLLSRNIFGSDGARKFVKSGQNFNFKQKFQSYTKNLNFAQNYSLKITILPKKNP